MSFTARDVDEAVQDDWGWSETSYRAKTDPFALLLGGKAYVARTVDQSRLGEGATDVWVVIEIDGRHFRKTGYHQSHDGTYWDGQVTEVRPKEKMITVYDNI